MEYSDLYQQFLNGKCNSKELEQLFRYFGTANEAELKDMILAEMEKGDLEPITEAEQQYLEHIHGRLTRQLFKEHKSIISLWRPIAAAASILLFLSIGAYFYFKPQDKKQNAQNLNQHHDFAPGENKAILTLANGQQIVLTGAKNGKLAVQGNMAIDKIDDGAIAYNKSSSETSTSNVQIEYNTMSVPRGGTYTLTLADGTKVWLNSLSSIKYPTAFTGKERNVEITGEAYFEVAHDKKKPFHVLASSQSVEVLGTRFNINAYPEEGPIKTTLLEGSVRINKDGQTAMLRPGQQAQASNHQISILDNTDTEQVVAWKDGFFQIDNADIQTIMRQAARWYDVEIVYEGKIPVREFSGRMRRNVNASKFLEMLSFFNVHFRIEGRKIIVTA